MKIEMDEDDIIQATVHLNRIKAIADSLTTVDNN